MFSLGKSKNRDQIWGINRLESHQGDAQFCAGLFQRPRERGGPPCFFTLFLCVVYYSTLYIFVFAHCLPHVPLALTIRLL